MDRVEQLARVFAGVLKEWLTPAQMWAVVNMNAAHGNDPSICASGDFCDSNMAMDEAFKRMGLEVLPGDPDEGMLQETVDLWNAAWQLAKVNKFWMGPQPLGELLEEARLLELTKRKSLDEAIAEDEAAKGTPRGIEYTVGIWRPDYVCDVPDDPHDRHRIVYVHAQSWSAAVDEAKHLAASADEDTGAEADDYVVLWSAAGHVHVLA